MDRLRSHYTSSIKSATAVDEVASDKELLAETSYFRPHRKCAKHGPGPWGIYLRSRHIYKLLFASSNLLWPLNLSDVFLIEPQHPSLKFANARRIYTPLFHVVGLLSALGFLL